MAQGTKEFKDMRYKVVCGALDKYPDLPNRTVARILFKENPAMFGSVENARACILYHKGLTGSSNLRKLSNKKYVKSV